MNKILTILVVITVVFLGLKRYQAHVNKAPNIEY
ncbi:SE2200 family small protein [Staphylococcus simulans]